MKNSFVKEHMKKKPVWLNALLSEKFFVSCEVHDSARKNEKNNFCGDCAEALCQHCIASHHNHWILQIRRYVYHDVIRLHDIQKLVDCAQVQAYIINSAKVVFLNSRPQPRPTKGGGGNTCCTCERSLQDSFKFCSVACKVDAHIRKSSLHTILPSPHPSLKTLNLQIPSSDTNMPSTTLRTTSTAPRGVAPPSVLSTPNTLKEKQSSPNSTLFSLPTPSSTHSTTTHNDAPFNLSSNVKDPNSCSVSKTIHYPSKFTLSISKSSTPRSSHSKLPISSPPKFSSFGSCYSATPHYSMSPAKVAKLTSSHTSHHLKSPSKFSRMPYGSPTKSSPHHLPKPTTLIATPSTTPYMTKTSYYLKPISIKFPKPSSERGHFSKLEALPSKRRKGVPNRSPLF